MAKTNAQRQADYRSRHNQGDGERLHMTGEPAREGRGSRRIIAPSFDGTRVRQGARNSNSQGLVTCARGPQIQCCCGFMRVVTAGESPVTTRMAQPIPL
jgi:hypothetical protein